MRTTTYAGRARAAASAWKAAALPPETHALASYSARPGGPTYPFCLPLEHAQLTLLPEAAGAAEFFAERGIHWHQGVAGGPGNHLLSSQVQCVNALFPMVADPALIVRGFVDVLPIAEPLEIEPGAYLTFEYIGEQDHLGEWAGKSPSRGAHSTSADAAIRYRTPDGRIEIALIEWKYTESYLGHRLSEDRRDIRRGRYLAFWEDPAGPIDPSAIPYDDIFVEPFYQLVRQQLLAWRMEVAREQDADVVRVVHIAPATNDAYYASLNRDSHRALGSTVAQVWQQMLRRPDRFISFDSSRFTDEERDLTSPTYRARYGHQ